MLIRKYLFAFGVLGVWGVEITLCMWRSDVSLWSQLSPPPMWVLGFKVRSLGLAARAFIYRAFSLALCSELLLFLSIPDMDDNIYFTCHHLTVKQEICKSF